MRQIFFPNSCGLLEIITAEEEVRDFDSYPGKVWIKIVLDEVNKMFQWQTYYFPTILFPCIIIVNLKIHIFSEKHFMQEL